jgi:hypothetical protein
MTFRVEFVSVQAVNSFLDSELKKQVKSLADEVYREVRKNTPVDTGLAKKSWTKKVQDKNFEIANTVPYIGVLDKGRHMTNRGMRGSKQAPKGIIGPSLNNIKGKN